jgi:hypothetical protein
MLELHCWWRVDFFFFWLFQYGIYVRVSVSSLDIEGHVYLVTEENAELCNWDSTINTRFSVFHFECVVTVDICRWRMWIPPARTDLNKGGETQPPLLRGCPSNIWVKSSQPPPPSFLTCCPRASDIPYTSSNTLSSIPCLKDSYIAPSNTSPDPLSVTSL